MRKAAALEAIATVNPDCTIWSDGSAKSGTRDGSGGTLIQLHRENHELETLVPAGSVCSSMRAELVAMLAAFTCLLSLPEESRSLIHSVMLCSDSLSGLQLLQRGPDAQQLSLAERVWSAMDALVDQGMTIALQWVPGHADIAGNEAADKLANRAAAECAQTETPIDLASARTAVRERARTMQAARAHRHPHPQLTPDHADLPRWEQVTLSQLRTGYCPPNEGHPPSPGPRLGPALPGVRCRRHCTPPADRMSCIRLYEMPALGRTRTLPRRCPLWTGRQDPRLHPTGGTVWAAPRPAPAWRVRVTCETRQDGGGCRDPADAENTVQVPIGQVESKSGQFEVRGKNPSTGYWHAKTRHVSPSSSVPAVRMHSSSLPSRILERVYRAWRVCRGVMKRIYRGVVWWQRLATGVPRRYHRQSEWTVSIFQVPARCGVVPARSLNVIIIRWPCHVSDGHCDNRSAGDSALLCQSCCNVCVLHEKCKTCLWSLKVIQPGLCSTHFFGLTRLWLIWQSRWLNSDSTQIPNLLTWLKSDSTQNPNLPTWFKSDSTHLSQSWVKSFYLLWEKVVDRGGGCARM